MSEPTIRRKLRLDVLDVLARQRGLTTDAKLARAIGVSAPLLCQIRSGERDGGAKFIHGCLDLFGDEWRPILFPPVEGDPAPEPIATAVAA